MPKAKSKSTTPVKATGIHATMTRLAGKLVKRTDAISKIKTKADLIAVKNVLDEVKKAQKQCDEGKASEVGPIEQGLKAVKERWKTWETQLDAAERALKIMILDYNTLQTSKAAKLQQDFNTGKIKKFETLESKLEDTQVSGGGVSLRSKKVYTVTDVNKVPRQYMVPDMVAIKKAIAEGKVVPGVEVTIEKTVAA